MSGFVLPMRPGLRLVEGVWPAGWGWQIKLDEERGVVVGQRLLNRHGQPLAAHKAGCYVEAIGQLRQSFPSETIDVGLMGFRAVSAFGDLRGALVVYDLPDRVLPWRDRRRLLDGLPLFPVFPAPLHGRLCFRLWDMADPTEAYRFARTLKESGCEGIVGRDPASYYQPGDSRSMAKCRFR